MTIIIKKIYMKVICIAASFRIRNSTKQIFSILIPAGRASCVSATSVRQQQQKQQQQQQQQVYKKSTTIRKPRKRFLQLQLKLTGH